MAVTEVDESEQGLAAGAQAPCGHFLSSSAFMRMRDQRARRRHVRAYLNGQDWPADGVVTSTELSPEAVGDWQVMFAIGVQVPDAFPWAETYGDGSYTLWLRDTDVTSWATVDYAEGRAESEVVQAGPRRLWEEVETAYRWWEAQGQPSFDRFGLTVTAKSDGGPRGGSGGFGASGPVAGARMGA